MIVMGSRGTFLKEGGFSEQTWHSTGLLHGVKVIEKNDSKSSSGLPHYSNTPNTTYIAVNQEGKFHQLRKYNNERKPEFDIDYGIDTPLTGKGNRAIHIHEYIDGIRQPGRFLNDEEYAKYKKYFVGIEE